jgi:hypothetical protein
MSERPPEADHEDFNAVYDQKHPSVELIDPDGDVVRIDCEIAPLIQWLWDHRMETFNSCQDNYGYVWIEFGIHSAEAFLDHIMEYGDDILESRRSPLMSVHGIDLI